MLDSAYRGTRVLEFASGLPAGVAGRFFADLGAEVLRIEQLEPAPDPPADEALLDWTRLNKRTLRSASGAIPGTQEIERLATSADVVITDLSPQRWPRELPSPEALVAANPHLVFLDITPFGRSGPYTTFASSDLVELALSSYLFACGLNDHEPVRIGIPGLVDLISGVNGAGGAMIALRHARDTGQGQVVDVSRLETMIGSALTFTVGYPMTGSVRRRSPTRIVAIGALLPCADGHVLLSTYRITSDMLYIVLQDERILDERFADSVGREMNQVDLYKVYREAVANRSKADVFRAGQEIRIQNAMVQTPLEILTCPQHASRSFLQPFQLASGRELLAPSLPIIPASARAKAAPARPEFVDTAGWAEPALPLTATVPAKPRAHALEGLHVVELTFAWAGPFMGRIMADYGAEVVKIESRYHPDTARGSDMVDLTFGDTGRWLDRSPSYMIANTTKHHMGMELTNPAGREVLLDLIRWADVLVENFTPRVLPNLGLGWDVFREVNPGLVMISTTGFGHNGPYRDYGAWGWGLESQAGITFHNGYLGEPDPLCYQPTIPDSFSATLGITAVMAALEERRKTGLGQFIDVSQYEGATFATLPEVLRAGITGKTRARLGNRHPWKAPQGVYPCEGRDEWVAVALTNDEQWQPLCRVIGAAELAADPALASHEGRWRQHDRIDAAIAAWTRGRTKRAAMAALQEAGVPAGAVQNSKDLQFDPQVQHLDYFRAATSTETGLRIFPGPWHRPLATPGEIRRGPSDFGEDNERVLREVLKYSDADVERVMASDALSTVQEGVIRPSAPGLPVEVQLERGYILSWDADYKKLPAEVAARHAARVAERG